MSDYAPIVQNLPQLQGNLNTRLTQLNPFLQTLPQPVPAAYTQLQTQRVNRGQAPWSLTESVMALQAARTGQAVTQKPTRSPWSPSGVWSNLRHDLGAMLSSIPRLPMMLAKEALEIPHLPEHLATAIQAGGGNLPETIQQLSHAPVVRMIPGAYTVGNVAGGDFAEAASHPLFTALDVLPAASGIAGTTKVGRAALEEAALNSARPRALRALATRTLDAEGNLIPNRLGAQTQRLIENTRLGQKYQSSFGLLGRDVMSKKAFQEAGALEPFDLRISRESIKDPLELIAHDTAKLDRLAIENGVADEARLTEIHKALEMNKNLPNGRQSVRDMATPQELPYVNEFIDNTRRLEDYELSNELIMRYQDESYSTAEGMMLTKARARMERQITHTENTVIPFLKEHFNRTGDERIGLILEHWAAGDYGWASKEMGNFMRRRTAIESPALVGAKAGPKSNVQLGTLKNWSNEFRKTYNRARGMQGIEAKAIPARWISLVLEKEVLPRVEALQRAKYQKMLDQGIITIPQSEQMIADMTEALGRKFMDDVPELEAIEYNKILRESAQTWKDYKAQGYDPIYVHHVGRDKALRETRWPRIRTTELTPGSLKQRAMAFTDTTTNPTLALTHQIVELLLQRGTSAWIDTFETAYGKTMPEARAEFEAAARRAYERDPSTSYHTYLDNMIKSKYTSYDRANWIRKFNGKPLTGTEAMKLKHKLSAEGAIEREPVYIPKPLADILEKLKPYDQTALGIIMDPILNVFRTSVLPLSPRWHVNNIIGGAIMLAGQTDPLTVWRHLNEARRLLSGDRSLIPIELRRKLGTANRDVLEMNYMGAQTSRRLFDRIQEYFARNGREGTANAINKSRSAGNKLVKGSFDANAWVDDLYRTMSYLYGKSKAERHGLTVNEAEHAGLELAKRTLQQWDEITPFERVILRSIIPFYGFTQHILRYTLKYPFDHPMRTAILGSVARAELEDLGTGLPQSYLDFITFGRPDKFGNVKGLSTRGLNPFSDVADMFTLSGWVGATNPLIGAVMQQSGIDPISAQAELFPNLRYDPSTGQLYQEQGNFALRLVNNLIPQSRVLTELTGMSNEFRELAAQNPESARRMVQSQLGLPVNIRNLNPTQEMMKQEVRRFQSQRDAYNEALTTGSDTYANEYTANRARLEQVRQLQANGVLNIYTPPQQTLSLPQMISPLPQTPQG